MSNALAVVIKILIFMSIVFQDDENEFYLLTKSLGLQSETPSTFSITDCFQCSHESSSLTLIKTWCKQLRYVSRRHDSFPKVRYD